MSTVLTACLRSLTRSGPCCAFVVLVVGLIIPTGTSASSTALADRWTPSTAPTQFIAKQFTEGLGRAPTPGEWEGWIHFFSEPSRSCGPGSMADLARAVFLGREFERIRYRRVEALAALSRAVLNRDLDANTYRRYRVYRRWPQVVESILKSGLFRREAAAICQRRHPAYYFNNSVLPMQMATGPGFRGTAAQLQVALDAEQRAGGGTVWLARAAVIHVDRLATDGQIRVPSGVQLATVGRPGPRSYEEMARLVRVGNPCRVDWCDRTVLAVDGSRNPATPGGQVQSVWIDGGGGYPRQPADAGSTVQLESGANSAIIESRLDAPIPRPPSAGTTLGLQGIGNAPYLPCSGLQATANLITVYSSDHFLSLTWADGITVDCEDARVERNTVVDATDAGIGLFGNAGADQRSVIRGNYILSAGNDAYSGIDVDPHGICACNDTTPRSFAGSKIEYNTLISGPSTGFGFGINLGIRPLFGTPPDGTGAAATDNGTGRGSARVSVGLAVSGMFNATLRRNKGHFILASINGCPMVESAAGVRAGLASFSSPPQPHADLAIAGCWAVFGSDA